ncbi:MAG TPA: enolase C-terminal domain-like protein [Terriglobia bacterium]|nr:enolase C-terminal domain-like protein [Terriglobia bacterium]
MKIQDIVATPVTVPMEAPLRWSMGIETGTTRTILRIMTDEGLVGIGETYGGDNTVRSIGFAKQFVLGMDPFDTRLIVNKLQSFRISYESNIPLYMMGGIEMACWDLMGKALGRPVASLLGGMAKDSVPFSAYLFYRYPGERGVGGEDSAEAMVDRCQALIERYGFTAIKLKGGVLPPEEELRTVQLLRKKFPYPYRIRFDPNAAWSVETSLRILPRMAECGLEFVEDPTWNLEGMSLVRRDVPVPLATNMCVISFDQIAPAVRLRAIDIILADVHYWGGFNNNQKLAGVCETFQLGLGMHSDRELGISTAAMIHFAAATPYLVYAADSHYHDQIDDVITERHQYQDGCFKVPQGPGLGVSLDEEKVEKYHRAYLDQGEVNEFLDPYRPSWLPNLPIF